MKKSIIKTIAGLSLTGIMAAPLLTVSCKQKESSIKQYHILALNDIHGEIPGYGDSDFDQNTSYAGAIRMADEMQKIASKYPDTLVLSGGDNNSSGKFSAVTRGETMYPVLKAMDIRYSAIGNHAWAWGTDRIKNYDTWGRTEKTDGKYFVTANVLQASDFSDYKWEIDPTQSKFTSDFKNWQTWQAEWADPYKIVDFGGHKVCLIGLTTKDSLNSGNKEEMADTWSFIDYNAAVHYAKYQAFIDDPELFNQIESFILFTHVGATYTDDEITGEAGQMAKAITTPFDAIIAGHTHQNVCGSVYNNQFNRQIVISQTKEKMQSFSDFTLTFDDSKPIGKRLKHINAKIITPNIDTSSQQAAHNQIEAIKANPRNDVVRNTCNAYETNKRIALQALETHVGATDDGLTFLQAECKKDYKYPLDLDPTGHKDILVEQAGAFAAKAELAGFNKYYEKALLPAKQYAKANVCYINNVSIHKGIQPNSEVTLKDLYNLYQYDDNAVTGALTYYQLEQIVRYMLTGANKTYAPGTTCTDEFKASPNAEPFSYLDLAFPYGPSQFYGMKFKVKLASTEDKQYRRYDYVPGSLLVYDPDPTSGCDLEKPETWKGQDYWMKDGEPLKYITIIMNSFTFDDGNKQNMIIKEFCSRNMIETTPLLTIKRLDRDVRDLARLYIEEVLQDTPVALSDAICKTLAEVVTE